MKANELLKNKRTTIKLTGDFSRGQRMAELFAEMEDAKATLDAIVAAGEHGSEKYHEALKAFKVAKAEHAKCRDALSDNHYDATMTKSRMEMTNFGCAQLERMAMTDIETRYSQLAQRMKDDEARIANAKERIAQAKAEMKKLTKAYNKHAANKANL